MQLALFDLDNTLLAGDSDFEWTQFLIDKGVLDRVAFEARNDEFYEQYKAGTLDIFEFLDFQLLSLAMNSRADLEAWHAEFMRARIMPLIGQKARDLVLAHQRNGDLCALVTATNSFVTGTICREFSIAHLIATVPAQQDGEFTGKPRGTPAFREGKIVRVDAWLEALGLWWGSFERSWFYSDSQNDLPLLARVSDPVAVDPDPALRAHAQSAGWRIMTLRD
jgi:HAD superfamily hydrolase (TIGR01490 family)